MVKFIYSSLNDIDKSEHWNFCANNHVPYTVLTKVNESDINIFYDITDLKIDLETLSEELCNLYSSYLTFLDMI